MKNSKSDGAKVKASDKKAAKIKLHRQYGEEKALKNLFFPIEQVEKFLKLIEQNTSQKKFSTQQKINWIDKLGELELKGRLNHLADLFESKLTVSQQNSIFKKASQGLEGWNAPLYWPLLEVLSRRSSFDEEDFKWMKALTPLWSAEFAIRSHLDWHGQHYFELMKTLKSSTNEHHRRWLSEGLRPFLPWGKKVHWIHENYKEVWSIVEELRFDDSLYVRKSVANHLNDLTKLDAEFALKRISEWGTTSHERWVLNHGLRTLIKKGDTRALKLIGLARETKVSCMDFNLKPGTVTLGETLEINALLTNRSSQTKTIQVDLVFKFKKAHGEANEKVFKGKRVEIAPKSNFKWSKRVPLKPITTRTYVAGRQQVALRINGVTTPFLDFNLKIKS